MTTRNVVISAKTMRLEFNGCDPEFIQGTCKGRCCWVSSNPRGTTIHVEPDEAAALQALGVEIDFESTLVTVVKPGCRTPRCFFQCVATGMCEIHGKGKPRSCYQSPFMLSKRDRLVIRNRYKMLPCYRAAPRLPVYRAFSSGLTLLFGAAEAARITAHLDGGGGDCDAAMLEERYHFLKEVAVIWNALRERRP